MVPPVRSPRSTAVCEDLSPFVCELRKRSKIVPKVTRGNSRPGTSALPRNTAVSDIQQQPRAVSWGRVEYMSDPPRGLLPTLAFSGSRSHTSAPWCEWLPVRLWGGSNHQHSGNLVNEPAQRARRTSAKRSLTSCRAQITVRVVISCWFSKISLSLGCAGEEREKQGGPEADLSRLFAGRRGKNPAS